MLPPQVFSPAALTASASELARQDEETSARAAEGFARMVELVEATLRTSLPRSSLSDEILAAARAVLGNMGGERASKRGRSAS